MHHLICILYNNAFFSVITSTQNSFTVNRLQQALNAILKNPHVEREICQKISEKHLLHLARQHDQDNLGVEMMYSSMKQSSPWTLKFRFERFLRNSKFTFLIGRRRGLVDASSMREVCHSFDFS